MPSFDKAVICLLDGMRRGGRRNSQYLISLSQLRQILFDNWHTHFISVFITWQTAAASDLLQARSFHPCQKYENKSLLFAPARSPGFGNGARLGTDRAHNKNPLIYADKEYFCFLNHLGNFPG